MAETRSDSDLSLPEFLSDRARHASDARLALDVACGFVVAAVALVWRGPAWYVIASAAVCFLAYGAWGISDRELTERAGLSAAGLPGLRVARLSAAVVGVAAGVVFIVSALFFLLGTIKS